MKPYLPLAPRIPYLQRLEYGRVDKDQALATYDQDFLTIPDGIEFVKIHVETFGGPLTGIKIPDLSDMICDGNQLDIQIRDIVQLVKRPRVIIVNDSYDFCPYIQGPIADNLRVFRDPLMRDRAGTPSWDLASLFQRCTKLEKVNFCPFGPNSFKWAVKKRALLLDSDCSSSSTSEIKLPPLQEVYVVCKNFAVKRALLLDSDCTVSSTSEVKLPPLQEVYVLCKNFAVVRIVKDIFYVLQNTLWKITVINNHFDELSPQPLSWDWLLSNLVKNHIIFVELVLFDLESLNLCPSLEELYLIGYVENASSSPVAAFRPVLKLPKLQFITLYNRICNRFNFGSLEYSPLLETIDLFQKRLIPSNTVTSLTLLDMDLGLEVTAFEKIVTVWRISCTLSIPLIGFMLEYLSLCIGEYRRTLTLNEILGTDLSTECVSDILPRNEVSHKCKEFYFKKLEFFGVTLSTLLQRYMSQVIDIHLIKFPHIRYVHSTLTLTDAHI